MGLIPKVEEPSPAFVHVDVDDLWAIAECYGLSVAEEWAHHVSRNALPRFQQLFREVKINATFFIVGRDLHDQHYAEMMRGLLAAGHRAANHSLTHSLKFRGLPSDQMAAEIDESSALIQSKLGVAAEGFRAPGYAWSKQLMTLLSERGYKYDGSLMPGPYGGIFRYMDARLQRSGGDGTPQKKTQYPLFSDTWNSIYPTPYGQGRLIELPSATSPLLRLPFQAGVCMRLGYPYFRACFEPYRWNRALPLVFLFHAADLADFSDVPYPFFQQSGFFNSPVRHRVSMARKILETIRGERPVVTTEHWLA